MTFFQLDEDVWPKIHQGQCYAFHQKSPLNEHLRKVLAILYIITYRYNQDRAPWAQILHAFPELC